MRVGDFLTLWSRLSNDYEQQEFPYIWEDSRLLVKELNSPTFGLFRGYIVSTRTGRVLSEGVYVVDPKYYSRFYNNREMIWKGMTFEYHLDQVMDEQEDLL